MQNNRLSRMLFAQGGLCFFCKGPIPAPDASVEHLVAKSHGGSDRDDNCVACCKSLNTLLGSMSLKEKIQVVLNQRGPFTCPNGTQRKVKNSGPQVPAKPKELVVERCAQIVANLKQRGKAKPLTLPKLKNVIVTLFNNKLSQHDVDALVQHLETSRVISIDQAKLTYQLKQWS